ncbi:MAG: hypothetical protein AAFP02_22860 [Bacteroidota bacterium]
MRKLIQLSSCMPAIQVRNLPEHIYEALKEAAQKERRSLSQQIVVSLAKALEINVDYREKRIELIEEIKNTPQQYPSIDEDELVGWVREDRDKR